MAGITGFFLLVEHLADVGRVGRKDDLAFLVENADLFDAFLTADGVDGVIQHIGLVLEHVVFCAALHGLDNLIRTAFELGNDLVLLGLQVQIGEDANDRHRDAADGGNDFVAYFKLHRTRYSHPNW